MNAAGYALYSAPMFDSPTVFVVGAGASEEAGLPIGSTLTREIANLLHLDVEFGNLQKGDWAIWEALRGLANEGGWGENTFIRSGREVADAMDLALSIDTFLETHSHHKEYVQLGKLGIARAIIAAEGASKMHPNREGNRPFPLRELAKTWYYSLARQLFTGIPAASPERAFENVAFVVFNYDRCLQTFLMRAVETYFRLSTPKAEELVKSVRIVHPYGSLGSIFGGTPGHLPFAPKHYDLSKVAAGIKTFSESCDVQASVQQLVYDAQTVIFLGFGFHEQNMKLLDLSVRAGIENLPSKRAFATTLGMSESDAGVVREQISYALMGEPIRPGDRNIQTTPETCAGLFSTYWRSLTA